MLTTRKDSNKDKNIDLFGNDDEWRSAMKISMTPQNSTEDNSISDEQLKKKEIADMKLNKAISEFVETEKSFIKSLQLIADIFTIYYAANREACEQLAEINCNFQAFKDFIYDLSPLLLSGKNFIEIAERANAIGNIREKIKCFTALLNSNLYKKHLANIERVVPYTSLIQYYFSTEKGQLLEAALQKISKPAITTQSIFSYVIMPVQRIPRYILLLKEIINNSHISLQDKKDIQQLTEVLILTEISGRTIDESIKDEDLSADKANDLIDKLITKALKIESSSDSNIKINPIILLKLIRYAKAHDKNMLACLKLLEFRSRKKQKYDFQLGDKGKIDISNLQSFNSQKVDHKSIAQLEDELDKLATLYTITNTLLVNNSRDFNAWARSKNLAELNEEERYFVAKLSKASKMWQIHIAKVISLHQEIKKEIKQNQFVPHAAPVPTSSPDIAQEKPGKLPNPSPSSSVTRVERVEREEDGMPLIDPLLNQPITKIIGLRSSLSSSDALDTLNELSISKSNPSSPSSKERKANYLSVSTMWKRADKHYKSSSQGDEDRSPVMSSSLTQR